MSVILGDVKRRRQDLGASSAAGGGAAGPSGRPDLGDRRPKLVRELALIFALLLVYRVARMFIDGQDDLAMDNAFRIWDLERMLWMPDEEMLQDWALQWPDLLKAANWYYVAVHFPATAAFLAYGWWRRPPAEYRWARRLISVLTALALIGHVAMPLAPPRMLSGLGFLDTMAVFGPSAYKGGAAEVANQFAAMPSLHVGWALLIAVVVVYTARSPWRWLILLHPAITLLVVVVTANHYWVDGGVAALLLGIALLVTPVPYGPAPITQAWRRSRQLITTRNNDRPVGSEDPPAGSTVTPTPSAPRMSSMSASSSPPRPRSPADSGPVDRITHS